MTMPAPLSTPNGTVTVEGDHATLTFERRLAHPIGDVWAALTAPAQRALWFGRTEIDPRQGGRIEMDPDDPPAPPELKHMSGRILVWDPPHVLEHEWRQAIVGEGVVRYELVADGAATILTFTHRGLSLRNAMGFVPGTHAYLDRLEALLDGTEIPGWSERYAALRPAYD